MTSNYATSEKNLVPENELLPFHCPTCKNRKRFRSLIALRLHTSIVHDLQSQSSRLLPKENDLFENNCATSLDALLDNASKKSDEKLFVCSSLLSLFVLRIIELINS